MSPSARSIRITMFSIRFVPVGITILNQHETVRALLGAAALRLVPPPAVMLAFPEKVAASELQESNSVATPRPRSVFVLARGFTGMLGGTENVTIHSDGNFNIRPQGS